MISLHTVDPMLTRILRWPFPFQRVLSLELPQTEGISRFDHRLFAILWRNWSLSGSSHFFSSSGSTSLLAFPEFKWRRCFWISSMAGTSWLMGKLFEIFYKSRANSGSSLGAIESTRIAVLKCFLKWSKIFSGGHFPQAGFKVENSLSSSLLIADWLILEASALKNSFVFKFSTKSD